MTPHRKRWHVAPPAPTSHTARFPHLHPIIVQALYNRGITTPEGVAAFLDGGQEESNPFALDGMHAAVTRLRHALRNGERIAVYGDFDVDGVTATTLLIKTLEALGGDATHYIPHRVDEGYGLNIDALTQLAEEGVQLVVTVDCGVRSLEEVAHANRLGLDVIITDHHSTGPNLPDAVAVLDPRQPASRYPFSDLAGVGVTYRLAQALLRSHRQSPVTDQNVLLEEQDLTDLVALGTVADLVPLLGENRNLVRQGLVRINQMERPGIAALCGQARLKPGQVTTSSIGFALGPRLNAAGRLAHAETAYQLLKTPYPAEAERLAEELDALNRERQQMTLDLYQKARRVALAAADDAPLLFAADPKFPSGIVGLAASRLVDDYYRPAVIIEIGDEVSRGSARSIPEFHITDALDACADLLIRYGGHAAAGGLTVANENLDELGARLRQMAKEKLSGTELVPTIEIDAEIEIGQVSWNLEKELSQLEPCGYDNPYPLFLSRDVGVQHQRAVGNEGKHLKLTLTNGRGSWDAIAFRQGDWLGKLSNRVDIVYHVEVNEWRGQRRLQLNVRDIRPAEDGGTQIWLDDANGG